jgi:hypothetical protein
VQPTSDEGLNHMPPFFKRHSSIVVCVNSLKELIKFGI